MEQVQDAVILAGGLGTRMLPASLFMPKETMPLVDTPILNHLIWEAAKAGVSRVHLVLSERKMKILAEFLENGPIFDKDVRSDLPRESLQLGTDEVEVIPHVQPTAGGVADAISVALGSIDGPFIVLLGDNLLMDRHVSPEFSGTRNASSASLKLVEDFECNGLPCVGVLPVDASESSKYGVVELSGNMAIGIIEKPHSSESAMEYILCGRYLFPENTASILDDYPISDFGELQSIHLLNHLIEEGGLHAIKLDNMEMYDSGDPLSWLKSQIDHALNREDIGKELAKWLSERM